MRTPQGARAAAICAAALAMLGAVQVPFEQVARDLKSPDTNVRLRAAQLLREAAYPEAALPLAPLITDAIDAVQLEAIRAELAIFLETTIASRGRFAEAAFEAGPIVLGPNPVPVEVLTELRKAMYDSSPDVAIESLYAFGALAVDLAGNARRQLLLGSGPELSALATAAGRPAARLAAVRVIGRVFGRRPDDLPINDSVGDAAVMALNDGDRAIRAAAADALGRMRYERAVQALTDLYQFHGRGEAADEVLDVLARIAHRSSVNFMAAALTTSVARTRRIAIEGLARMGDPAHAATVQAALAGERDASVILAGAFAAVRLGTGRLDALIDALGDARRREQAFNYLIELAPGRADQFGPYTQNPQASVRTDLADILGLAADPAGLPVVESLMRDRDAQVAHAAERAASRLRAATRTF
jgi:HEAT repeat protein